MVADNFRLCCDTAEHGWKWFVEIVITWYWPVSFQILKDKFLVKQHIRQTVLQRTSSKTHMENVDEETEAKLAQVINTLQKHI